ncbi:ankyrin repeat-containing domain protein [Trichoderma chlorosporum]
MSDPSDYTVGWICAIRPELVAAQVFLDEEHVRLKFVDDNDNNVYTLGRMGEHNVAMATLPNGQYGLVSAATVAKDMQRTFPNLRFGLMVGIGGGAPGVKNDIRLGDIVVSEPENGFGGGFLQTGFLNKPPNLLNNAVADLRAAHEINGHQINAAISSILQSKSRLKKMYQRPDPSSDRLYRSQIIMRPEREEDGDNPAIHYGIIASANKLMKDALVRDQLAKDKNILCFEMEAAGLMNDFPCLVIRGICDYADSHKNKQWRGYAAMAAAAYGKDLLSRISPSQIQAQKRIGEIVADIQKVVSTTAADVKVIKADVLQKEHTGSDIFNSRQVGTGQWLLHSPQYQDWVTSEDGNTLFCEGMPGAGKTVLASVIIDNLREKCQIESETGMAYIYCTYKGANEQRVDLLLASLTKQLVPFLPSLPVELETLFGKHKRAHTRPSLDELIFLLSSVIGQFLRVNDTSWAKFLTKLFDLQSRLHIKLLVTSRPILEITKRFDSCKSLEIRAQKEDVLNYLNSHLVHLPPFVAEAPRLQEEIKSVIASAVDGMFLLVKLYLDSLKGKNIGTADDLYKSAYDMAMERINGQVKDEMELAKEVLSWILLHALAVEAEDHVVSVCAGLVTIDPESNYFERTQYDWFPAAEDTITSACATYLSFRIFETGACEQYDQFEKRLKLNPLYSYAANNWGHHARRANVLDDAIFHFLSCRTKIEASSQALVPLTSKYGNQHYRRYPTNTTGLHLAVYFGANKIASRLLKTIAIDATDGDNRTSLSWAAEIGHGDIVKLLLEEGADIEWKDHSDGQTPLGWAAQNGHENIIKLLIEKGANLESRNKASGQTPLGLAARNGHGTIVELLLKERADIESKDEEYGQSPLSWAARNGHEEVVALLLEKGAYLESRDRLNQGPITLAAKSGHEAIVRLLLEKSADFESKDDKYGQTTLSVAAKTGREAIVELLLEKGAELELKDELWGQSPLSLAARTGQLAMVRLLLKKGADIESKDNLGQTPLSWAAKHSEKAVISLLLENGANVESKNNFGQTPISLAAETGHQDVVELLLKCGADFESTDNYGQTPLGWAVECGHEEVVELLLKNGADLESKDQLSQTPLSLAAKIGQKAIIAPLLQRGANIESANKHGQTPLSLAAEEGHLDVVTLLVDHGADMESKDQSGQTPLDLAVKNGHKAIPKSLLCRGAKRPTLHRVTDALKS